MSDERLLLVQDLVDGRLSSDDARMLRGAIEKDPDLAEAHHFLLWLNAQLPEAVAGISEGVSLEADVAGAALIGQKS